MDYGFLKWTGHAGFMFETGGTRYFIDPFKIGKIDDHADVVFITHSHFDHLSVDDLEKIADQGTLIIAPQEAVQKLPFQKIKVAAPGRKGEAEGLNYEGVHAYNTEPDRLGFHPKNAGMLGYVLEIEGKRIYHAGDTDVIPEMKNVTADLALLPSGGTYTMNLDQAVQAAGLVKAKHYAPIHYKALLGAQGSKDLEKRFSELVKNSVILKEINEPFYSF